MTTDDADASGAPDARVRANDARADGPEEPDLAAAVRAILHAHPGGLTEFAFFAALAARGFRAFERDSFADSLALFRSHFLLFHVLHVLRAELVAEGAGALTIEALSIRLVPRGDDGGDDAVALDVPDPLAAYYLDRSHLDSTTSDDLSRMLDAFWARFAARADEGAALRTLDLGATATWDEVRTRHKELAFTHHPDRGGDAEKLAAINAAMRVLRASRGR